MRQPLEKIIEKVCKAFEVNQKMLFGDTRTAHVVEARVAFAKILREQEGYDYNRIGNLLGGKSHSTGLRLVKRGFQRPNSASKYKQLTKEINN